MNNKQFKLTVKNNIVYIPHDWKRLSIRNKTRQRFNGTFLTHKNTCNEIYELKYRYIAPHVYD
jgi:hypothetical protein